MPSKAALEAYAAMQAKKAKEDDEKMSKIAPTTRVISDGKNDGDVTASTSASSSSQHPAKGSSTTTTTTTPTSAPTKEQLLKAGSEFARKKATETLAGYDMIADGNLLGIPRFDRSELRLGKVLGRGGFGVVSEILGITLSDAGEAAAAAEAAEAAAAAAAAAAARDGDEEDEDDAKECPEGSTPSQNRPKSGKGSERFAKDVADVAESRAFIAEHCIRRGGGGNKGNNNGGGDDDDGADKKKKGDARYAVKCLLDEVRSDPAQFIQGIIDMNVETNFLAAIEHPNIIKMRAYASGDTFSGSYFIVMDRLYDTLERRLIQWAKLEKKHSSLLGRKVLDKKGTKRDKLLEARLAYAFDLSAALEYLHNHRIIYRDLKPENIGFDVRDDIKLFDFGLAKELNIADRDSDGTYMLTGDTGSLRYMAPEVAFEKPYNFSADTYSFAILLWEVMSLSKPFDGYTPSMHRDRVMTKGVRPKIDMSWPNGVRNIMQRGWSENIGVRPPMKSITAILKKEVTRLRNGDDSELQHYRRRSTFVLRPRK